MHNLYRWDLSRKHYQIPLKARIHPPTTPKTPQDNKKPPPGTPDTPPVPQEQRWLLPSTHKTFWEAFESSRDVRENSGRRKSIIRRLLSVWNVWLSNAALGNFYTMSRMLSESLGIYGGVLGVLDGVGEAQGASGTILPSISLNFRKSQIRSLTFSNWPGDFRCLKYQNVPTLPSFWPIGNPRERFQSWDKGVYFISVSDDHTVADWA